MKRKPLTLYVLWHPKFEEGYLYAIEIYTKFTHDIDNPAARGISIPVLFPSQEKNFEHRIKIGFDNSEKIVIVLLIEENMLLDEDWRKYVQILKNQCEANKNYTIYPVAISETALNFPYINSKHYVRLYEIEQFINKKEHLIFILAHELCRFLYGIERIADIDEMPSPPPIKLFLSHAKQDGVDYAKQIKQYIDSDTPLDDFFDTQDIAPSYEFAKEIEQAIPNCMLFVIHTDKYSSREWCRKEILIAKDNSIPIIVLDCLNYYEQRSFPYMANVQTIRFKEDTPNFKDIITIALLEVLRHKYQSIFSKYILDTYNLKINDKNVLSYPPELFSLVQSIDPRDNLVIYPDPPLGIEELALLKKYNDQINYITPTLIHSIDIKSRTFNNQPLIGMKVGISISEINEENLLGLNMLHMRDMMVEIARYLLVMGVNLSYGGDIRYRDRDDFNFVEILSCLVENHNKEHVQINQRVTNYVANYLHKDVTEKIQADLFKIVKFKFISPLDSISYNNISDVKYIRYSKARDLSNMRQQMNADINARIAIGGKKFGFEGILPGILEEVILAMGSKKPVYLVGAYGGITSEIIKCLIGEKSDVISEDYQFSHDEYGKFNIYYNKMLLNEGGKSVNYRDIANFLQNKGINSLNNELNEEENKLLFYSSNTTEIISLILKGLLCKNKKFCDFR